MFLNNGRKVFKHLTWNEANIEATSSLYRSQRPSLDISGVSGEPNIEATSSLYRSQRPSFDISGVSHTLEVAAHPLNSTFISNVTTEPSTTAAGSTTLYDVEGLENSNRVPDIVAQDDAAKEAFYMKRKNHEKAEFTIAKQQTVFQQLFSVLPFDVCPDNVPVDEKD
ncbi:uncharacterized protein LOC119683424 [Teleopsis dalmanni]|uniref:uncharacterized protein LOC119683424 n=1 Tax=Teleopsis dalmanni TaxID=139649 RepID=UPI0018CE2CD8|nr:uncharacterized protein LOC119683424 [Teleopsis dalmanni]